MTQYLDSSALLCSVLPDDPDFAACDTLLAQEGNWTSSHALNEVFATLTGGRLGVRIDADVAAAMIRESIVPCVRFIEISVEDVVTAQGNARQQGVRGGAIYDYMHLVAARKAGVERLITLNLNDFNILRRDDDPLVERP
jgi:predicted nucleic acid-binding protein